MKNKPRSLYECNRAKWAKYYGAPSTLIAGRKVRLLFDSEIKDWHERFNALSHPPKKIPL